LVTTKPTTRAGIVALINCVRGHHAGEHEWLHGRRHEPKKKMPAADPNIHKTHWIVSQ
jgi:hypothetical protein